MEIPEIPDYAVMAAAAAIHNRSCDGGDTSKCARWLHGADKSSPFHQHHEGHVQYYLDHGKAALEAALPFIPELHRNPVWSFTKNQPSQGPARKPEPTGILGIDAMKMQQAILFRATVMEGRSGHQLTHELPWRQLAVEFRALAEEMNHW
jgi:hypothetical protein